MVNTTAALLLLIDTTHLPPEGMRSYVTRNFKARIVSSNPPQLQDQPTPDDSDSSGIDTLHSVWSRPVIAALIRRGVMQNNQMEFTVIATNRSSPGRYRGNSQYFPEDGAHDVRLRITATPGLLLDMSRVPSGTRFETADDTWYIVYLEDETPGRTIAFPITATVTGDRPLHEYCLTAELIHSDPEDVNVVFRGVIAEDDLSTVCLEDKGRTVIHDDPRRRFFASGNTVRRYYRLVLQ